jgi:hypothetical protein
MMHGITFFKRLVRKSFYLQVLNTALIETKRLLLKQNQTGPLNSKPHQAFKFKTNPGIFLIIFLPVGLLLWAGYLIAIAPERSLSDPKFLVQTRFLFVRFRPERYWWGIMVLLRSFLLLIISFVTTDSVLMQAFCVSVVRGD